MLSRSRTGLRFLLGTFLLALLPGEMAIAQVKADASLELVAQLREFEGTVYSADERKERRLGEMLSLDVRARRTAVNQRETAAWREMKSREEWERYRDAKINALRASLGEFPPVPADLKVKVTRTIDGDGFRIENVVFESRPGLWVTANLYSPASAAKGQTSATPPLAKGGRPGILICHSHHNPKTQSELQDMGMTWARLGCVVLVPDQLGHGERRQHPFVDEKSYTGSFRPTRQDYYFRYNSAMQLHTIGESLVGWMAWDMMRGVDLLLSRPGVDPKKIILLGSVAGGGDPTAVTAAIDPQIAAVVPFNFGGPQPETTFPLPPNPEDSFNYAGGGSWESTRNLRLSMRDGFLPWVIVGSVAPRRLIYAHEFKWDREHDPVWARFQKIFAWYDAPNHLSSTNGSGKVTGTGPENTHCNNIGAVHRKPMYADFKQWFDIPEPAEEYQKRVPASDLLCLTPKIVAEIKPRRLCDVAAELGASRAAAARAKLAALNPAARHTQLRKDWTRLLGDIEPAAEAAVTHREPAQVGLHAAERFIVQVGVGIEVPVLLVLPERKAGSRVPVVVGVAQGGKREFLVQRAETIAALLEGGIAVCLPDLRGTGETRPNDDSRGRQSTATSLSSTELMLGRTLVGLRLKDLRTVIGALRRRAEINTKRIALWGDSFAAPNPADTQFAAPHDAEMLPRQSEPLGGLLALLGGLYEDDIGAVAVQGGLAGFDSLLQSPFCYVPHDAIVPGAIAAGDLSTVTETLSPRPVRLEGLVDGLNRRVSAAAPATALADWLRTHL